MFRAVRDESLANFGVRHRPEIDHRLRREELEVRHRLVRAGNHPIDLIRFPCEHLLIAYQVVCVWHAASSTSGLEAQRETLDGTKAPRDAGREQRIDECKGMRQHRPPFPGGARQPMLNTVALHHRHDGPRIAERGGNRRVTLEKRRPFCIR